jgi:putative ABC transport system ATP-binding protein
MEAGEHVALTGPSGCGKSTLLHLISGILRPDSGLINLGNQNLGALSEQELDAFRAQNIGYVFQTFHLLEGLTVLENVEIAVTFAGGDDYTKARTVLVEMGLEDRLDYYPEQLSVGQRQRVAVARAIVNQPPLVLADEPTANLDTPRSKVVIQLIRETCRKQQAALLVVTHDTGSVEQFDRVVEFREQFKGDS